LAFLLIALLSAGQPSFAENAYETVGWRFTILPLSGFSSDDGPGYGFRAAVYVYDGSSVPYSRAYTLQAFFTTKGKWAHQVEVDCPQVAPGNRLEITLRYDKEETTSYSGDLTNSQLNAFTSPERTFEQVDPYLTIRLIRDLRVPWKIQYRLRVGTTQITPNDPTTSLIGQLAPLGFDGGELAQAGVSVRYDTRDNYINSHTGRLDEIGLEWAVGGGGDFNGGELSLQHRHFARLHDRVVFAQRFLATFTVGDVPFYEQPKLGSSKTLRGPSADRFRDEARILTNTEIRWLGVPVSKRHQVFGGLNFFGGVGQVFRRRSWPSNDNWQLGIGTGLRLYWYSTVVRADYAVSDGDSALYMRFAQIF
jgi:outer membrane protein assembly factor BamA